MTSLFAPTFDKLGVAAEFSPRALCSHMVRFEAELARAAGSPELAETLGGFAGRLRGLGDDSAASQQTGAAQTGAAQTGAAQTGAAETSAARARSVAGPDTLSDADLLTTLADSSAGAAGNPAVPLVAWLKARVAPQHKQYLHFGATSQDVIDSALMLATRNAAHHVSRAAHHVVTLLAHLAITHAETPDAGRTLMQQAWPTTFGLRSAQWGLGVQAALDKVDALQLPVQYGGAVGTLAASVINGENVGARIRAELAAALQLADPGATWHTQRQAIADQAHALASLCGATAKVANDLILLAQTEVAAVAEAAPGGSSAMPHKRNPVAAVSARACATRAPQLAATLYAAMSQEFERGAGTWHTEWETLAELWALTGAAVAWLEQALTGLEVNETRFRELGAGTETAFAGATTIPTQPYAAASGEARRIAQNLTSKETP